MSTEQKPVPASVNMDARNFLRAINSSAQSKVVFFENVVRRLGQETKRNYRLVALQPTNLMFEDVESHDYYIGDIKKDGQRFIVNNIKKINVVEEKKADLFAKNCTDLVEAISESDFKSADRCFNKIELQRFRSRVIPESGWITTRDGEARRINVQSDAVNEDRIPAMIKAFAHAVSDSVEVSDGLVVSGTFNETGEQFTLPVDEFTRRRIVARRMKQVAESAFKSGAFQKLVGNIAGLVSAKKVAEAVEVAAKFLKEEQEFCLLTQGEMKMLVDNTLAAQGEFNPFLIEDVSTLMYRTNAKINRESIVECWTKTAQKAQNAALMTQAKSLLETKNFANDYGVFLEDLFNEEGDVNSNRAKAYLVSMKVVKSVLSHVEGQEQLVQDIDRMVQGLQTGEPSADIIYQAEELLAGISDTIIDRVQTLENYNQMPGVEDQPEPAQEEPAGEPVPLPELGGDDDFGGDLGGDLGGGEPGMDAAAAPAPAGAADMNAQLVGAAESKKANKAPVNEGKFTPIEKMTALEMEEELLSWKTDGHIYLKEDGFEDCFNQLNRYIDRCSELGATGKSLREQFERIRDVAIEEGNDVSLDLPEDPYEGKVSLKEGAKIDSDYLSEDIGGLAGPAKMLKSGGDASGMSELQDDEGVADKGMKKVSGTDADGTPSASGAEEHEGGLSMAKDFQSKTKGVPEKGLKKADGRSADHTPNPGGAEEGDTDMAKELQNKTKSIAEGSSFIDKIADTLGEEELKTGATFKKGSGGYEKAHDLEMDELQGKDGVETGEAKKVSGKDASGVPSAKGAEKTDTDMAKDHQDKTDGLAESVAESVECEGCDDKDCDCQNMSEDQRKGPRQHPWGRKKSAIAPREVKEGKEAGKSVSEEVMVYDQGTPLDEVIQAVLNSMKPEVGMDGMDGEMGGMPPVPPPGMGDEVGGEMPAPEAGMDMGGEELPGEGLPGEEIPGGAPPSEPPMGGPGADAALAAGKEFDAENVAAGIPPEGEPGHDEMESPEEKDAEADAAAEADGGNPFAKGGEKSEKKGPPPPKKEKKDDKKEDKKDDKKKEESFDKTLGSKLSSIKEEKCGECKKDSCACCKKCKKADCSC